MLEVLIAIFVGLVLFFLIVMVIDGNRFVVKNYKVVTEKTKHSHRFLVLSDLHGKEYGYQNEKLLKKIEEQNPTAILLPYFRKFPDTISNDIHDYRFHSKSDTFHLTSQETSIHDQTPVQGLPSTYLLQSE